VIRIKEFQYTCNSIMNKKTIKSLVIKNMLNMFSYYLVWIIIYIVITKIIDPGGQSRTSYGIISSWWAALYFCQIRDIKIKTIYYYLPLGICCYLYMTTLWPKGEISLIGVCSGLIILLSPLIINSIIMRLKGSMINRTGQNLL
jgi:hypothetical protein